MKFLLYALTAFSFLFPTFAEDGPDTGLYFSTNIFSELGVGVGHKFRVTDTTGIRLQGEYEFATFDHDTDHFHESLHRYGVFYDYGLGESRNFVYLGSSFAHVEAHRALGVETGIVLRLRGRTHLRLGHEYRSWGDAGIGPFTLANNIGGHTARISLVHFFRRE